MTNFEKLTNWFTNKDEVIVALSGGVDSALVACAAYKKLGESAIAVTADYKTLSQEELDSAKKICSEIGINHFIIEYDELSNEKFVQNDSNRCYYCRSELGFHLQHFAYEHNVNIIVDGTNIDDLSDYRPGLKALEENNIRSPLVETNFMKSHIRFEAKKIGLSFFDKPSNACLASRIPWGQRVTTERLARIEMAESMIKQIIDAKQIRVRDLDGTAKIELDKNELHLLFDDRILSKITIKLKQIGFKSVLVDHEGYKSGKLNVILD
jgi:uncharacterized protein